MQDPSSGLKPIVDWTGVPSAFRQMLPVNSQIIVLSHSLFEKVFDAHLSGYIPFFASSCLENFEVSLDEAKSFIADDGTLLAYFGPDTIYFENRIIAHIVATTLPPKKSSLSTLSTRDVFVVYCLLRKLNINWLEWILGFILESCQYPGGNTSLPYGMIVTRIIKAMGVDVSSFPVNEISSTYNDRAFSSMGYVLDERVWVKKASYKPKIKHASPEGPNSVKIDEA
ncbi:hypothetical protein HAX54_014172 [Datura stramonium]|uniref:Uncharacterized protein n=1 Tax=Datura stramonium TaxID=4076 RepID=A0ABS8TPG8_DATST|nr:hypothetical protein [Datura stramonium]